MNLALSDGEILCTFSWMVAQMVRDYNLGNIDLNKNQINWLITTSSKIAEEQKKYPEHANPLFEMTLTHDPQGYLSWL